MNIVIKRVIHHNRKEVLNLSVEPEQEHFIESPKECLREADKLSLWRPIAIYVDKKIVGFAMYGKFLKEGGRVWLDRFLIDKRYQGKGYGKAALYVLLKHIKQKYKCTQIYLSCYPENLTAIKLYQNVGFCFNGEKDINGEDVMIYTVQSQA